MQSKYNIRDNVNIKNKVAFQPSRLYNKAVATLIVLMYNLHAKINKHVEMQKLS
jgi:hypothetical protein